MTGYKENQLIHIDPIEAFQDNYIWLIHNDQEYFLPYDQFPWFQDAPIKHISPIPPILE